MKFLTICVVLILSTGINAKINPPGCGRRPLATNRVVGGVEAKQGDWPWQGIILFNDQFICGCAVISEKHAATAAHCIPTNDTTRFALKFGLHSRLQDNVYTVVRNVKNIIVHENYNENTVTNDIAILEFEDPIAFNDYILPCCIPDGTENYELYDSWTTGWGRTITGGSTSIVKLEVKTPILDALTCWIRYFPFVNLAVHLCAGESNKNMGPCNGDSGGPLSVQSTVDSQWYCAGLTSFGVNGCGNGGVYTRVSNYKSWIEKNIK